MTGIFQDLRFALRLVFKNPTFAAVAVLTLGLGIGAVTAIFSVVNAVVLRPLPYPGSDRLVRFYTQFPNQKFDKFWFSPPEYLDLQRDAQSLESVTGYQVAGAAITAKERPIRADAAYTTWTFARTLGVQPELGRFFNAVEDLPGNLTAVVISHRLWQGAFAGDAEIVGRRVIVDGMTATVVGVMPRGFAFPEAEIDLYIPGQLDPSSIRRGNHFLNVVGRLKPGVSLERARGELGSLMAGWGATGGNHTVSAPTHPAVIYSLKDEVVGSVRSTLWLLQGAVLLVLLIACANISNLLLARAEARSREIAVRNALGANRSRLVRQFLTESMLLGLMGGALGLVLAIWGVDLTVMFLPKGAPRATEIGIDFVVLGFGVAAALVTSLLFGLAPILHTRVQDLGAALKEGQRASSSPRQRFRRALVVSEVSLAVTLVIGCALVIKSFIKLQDVDTGLQVHGLVTGQVEIVDAKYPTAQERQAFWTRLQERLRAEPGVTSVTLLSGRPPIRPINANDATFEGLPQINVTQQGVAQNIDFWQTVGEDFFETMGIRLVRGRFLTRADTLGAPEVVVVNEALARRFYPDTDPIGKRVSVTSGGPRGSNDPNWQTIVGVVADVKQQGLEAPTGTEVFIPLNQTPGIYGGTPGTLYVALRGEVAPQALMATLRRAVTELDATVPVYHLETMDDVMYEAVGKPRFIALLLIIFAGLALALASIGIYGVMSYSVAQRTRELGIRMALGAHAGRVRRLVMSEGLVLASIGVGIGLAGSLALNTGLARQLAGMLYGVRPVEPTTFGSVAAGVLVVAALACFIPARRATKVDPMVALRHD